MTTTGVTHDIHRSHAWPSQASTMWFVACVTAEHHSHRMWPLHMTAKDVAMVRHRWCVTVAAYGSQNRHIWPSHGGGRAVTEEAAPACRFRQDKQTESPARSVDVWPLPPRCSDRPRGAGFSWSGRSGRLWGEVPVRESVGRGAGVMLLVMSVTQAHRTPQCRTVSRDDQLE